MLVTAARCWLWVLTQTGSYDWNFVKPVLAAKMDLVFPLSPTLLLTPAAGGSRLRTDMARLRRGPRRELPRPKDASARNSRSAKRVSSLLCSNYLLLLQPLYTSDGCCDTGSLSRSSGSLSCSLGKKVRRTRVLDGS